MPGAKGCFAVPSKEAPRPVPTEGSTLRLEPLDDGNTFHDRGMLVAALEEISTDTDRPADELSKRAVELYRAT